MAAHGQMTAVANRTAADELDQILGDGAVRSVYQPIVELATGRVVAFEALARGPVGADLESPGALFAAARAAGRLGELDWACRVSAMRGALEAGLGHAANLFVNVEPEAIAVSPTSGQRLVVAEAVHELDVVVEVTERSLVASPAALLAAVAAVRAQGCGVALDDVGAEVASLALMPFLRPDVIKLDLRLIQDRPDQDIAAIVGAVDAQAERTGARVLAEGIETPAHLDTALAMGATLGQGWLWGAGGALPARGAVADPGTGVAGPAIGRQRSTPVVLDSTMEAAATGRPRRRSTKPLLLEMSRHLERQALAQGSSVVVLGAFQTANRFTPATGARYAELARRSAFVAAMGVGMPDEPVPGVRGGRLRGDDPLVDEWSVAVIGAHFAAALAAVDLHDDGPEELRRFDYVLTYDRDRVLGVARSLMARVLPVTA